MAASRADAVDPDVTRVLTLAIQFDREGKFLAACNMYTEGINLLFKSIKSAKDANTRSALTARAKQYLDRAELLKKQVEDAKQKPQGYHEQILIEDGAVGYGLETVFIPYIDSELTEVQIDDPYIRANHQIHMFLRFCALLVKHARQLRVIRLKTSCGQQSPEAKTAQMMRLEEMKAGLLRHNVSLVLQYSETLHDREIRFNNGWLIKIGRGLDYFKRPEGENNIDYFELDFRPCHSTTIDIVFKGPAGNQPAGSSKTK
ncbi:hypothetical protein RvY_14677 [Ramazzottius varieornatus]|uniref:MIT domain-containing protein n=1 Tax=Ramazzottius varieornatus TaxID=947166 RepID=A0A1D1VVX0_RAMVA|nr:hypothetical protein RvY_14677 [Ramazzottius varieornatus]